MSGSIDTNGPQSPSRPTSPALSDTTESVTSSSIPTGAGGAGGSSQLGSLASAQLSTLNLSALGLPPSAVATGTGAAGSSSSALPSSLLTGFNAISTVLNNPKKKQHPIDPHSSRYTPLPAHKDAEIAKVSRDAVQQYIDDVGQQWQRYVRNRDLGKKGKARMSSAAEGAGVVESEAAENPIAAAAAAAAQTLKGKGKLPPLSAVPQIFFDEEFNLGNPYTFDIVTEKYGAAMTAAAAAIVNDDQENISPSPTTGRGAGDDLEKLSHYSDLVEQHLLHEISTRSSSFFSALGALQDLSQSSASCLSLIRSLRSDLVSINDSHVKTGLRIVRQQDERWTLLKEMQGVERIREWCEAKRMAELMIGQGEYEEALVVIARLKAETAIKTRDDDGDDGDGDDQEGRQDNEDTVDLSQIPAIRSLLPQLEDLQSSISQALENELSSLLSTELEAGRSNDTETTSDSWSLVPRAEPLLQSLLRTDGVERCLTTAYRPIVLSAVRNALRSSLPAFEDDAALVALFDLLDDDLAATGKGESRSGEAGMVAARRLRELDVEAFTKILQHACNGVEGCLNATALQMRRLLAILDGIARHQGEANGDGQDDEDDSGDGADTTAASAYWLMPARASYSLPQSLATQLHSAIEVAHILLARLISLRSSSHTDLTLDEFMAIFNPLMAFVDRTERITTAKNDTTAVATSVGMRRLIPLRSTLLNQSKEWLRNFHRVRLERAAKWVEEEVWAQTDVKQADVKVACQLVNESKGEASDGNADDGEGQAQSLPTLPVPIEGDAATPNRTYYVVPATLQVLHLTREYMSTLISLSHISATTEVMSRAVEFLKQFNSRTCQVVLGAGAMRSAGLKNITAKHLALASQSLSLFIHLIPYLRETVRQHLSDERQAVMLVEFDKLKRDYQEHQNEIHSKLVAIMGDRLSVHCKGLAGTDWNADSDASGPTKSIADLVKETMTLQKVLSRYLAPSTVDLVLNQVLDAIVKRVGVEYARVEVTAAGGDNCRLRMQKDVEYLDTKLGVLKNDKIAWDLEGIKAVVNSKTPPATKASSDLSRRSEDTPEGASQEQQPLPPSSAPSTSQMSSSSSTMPSTPTGGAGGGNATPTGPAAYRSRMFPFGRRAGSGAAASGRQSPTPASPSTSGGTGASYFGSYLARGTGALLPNQTPTKASVASERRMLPDEEGAAEEGRDASASIDALSLPAALVQNEDGGGDVTVTTERTGEDDSAGGAAEVEHADAGDVTVSTADAVAPAVADVDDSQTAKTSASQEALEAQNDPEAPSSAAVQVQPDLISSNSATAVSTGDSDAGAVAESSSKASSSPPLAAMPAGSNNAPTDTSASDPQSSPAQSPTASPPATGPATPSKPVRMTLQQRLAEAARKRSQAQAQAQAEAQQQQQQQQEEAPAPQSTESTSPPPPPTPSKDEPLERPLAVDADVQSTVAAEADSLVERTDTPDATQPSPAAALAQEPAEAPDSDTPLQSQDVPADTTDARDTATSAPGMVGSNEDPTPKANAEGPEEKGVADTEPQDQQKSAAAVADTERGDGTGAGVDADTSAPAEEPAAASATPITPETAQSSDQENDDREGDGEGDGEAETPGKTDTSGGGGGSGGGKKKKKNRKKGKKK